MFTSPDEETQFSILFNAIPLPNPKPEEEFGLMKAVLVEHVPHHELVSHSLVPICAGLFDKGAFCAPEAKLKINDWKEAKDKYRMKDVVCMEGTFKSLEGGVYGNLAATAKVAIFGDSSRENAHITVLQGCTNKHLSMVRDVDTFYATHLKEFLEVENVASRFRYETGNFTNTVKRLIGFVDTSITGQIHYESFDKSKTGVGFEASLTIPEAPVVPAVEGEAHLTLEKSAESHVDGEGVLGIGLSLTRLERSSLQTDIQIRGVQSIQRCQDAFLEDSLHWARMGCFIKRKARPALLQRAFALGTPSNEGNQFETYSSNVERTARILGTELGGGVLMTGSDEEGHVIMEIQPESAEAEGRLPGFSVFGWFRSIHILYKAKVSDLSKMYTQLKNNEPVSLQGHKVVTMTPTVPVNTSQFLPIRFQANESDGACKPGAILRKEGNLMYLIPLGLLDTSNENKDVITLSSNSMWQVFDSVHCVKTEDIGEYTKHGYLEVQESEEYVPDDDNMKNGLKDGSRVLMGRQLLAQSIESDFVMEGIAAQEEHIFRDLGVEEGCA